MDRKKFIKKACGLGACSCIGMGFLPTEKATAAGEMKLDWKEDFIKYRFAKLIEILNANLDKETRDHIIESLGKVCANNSIAGKYKNNIDGFFKEINDRWGEKASYDKENGVIRIETPERDCVCPLIDSKLISESICQCSVGWQTQTYNTILDKEVEARCVESVVRGSTKCVFEIRIV